MRFTKETVEAINREYFNVKNEHNYHEKDRGVYMSDGGFESAVYTGGQNHGWHVADVGDLRATIDQLEMFAEAITNITGVVI